MHRLFALTALSLVCLLGLNGIQAADKDKEDDTPKAAKTRRLLDTKMTVNWKDVPLRDVLDEITEEIKDLHFRVDTAGGVSNNQKLSYSGKDVTLAEIFDKMFAKNELGYYVISKKGDTYDGLIKIKKGKDRGFLLP